MFAIIVQIKYMITDNPYLIDTPALISFSGGRTSGFMLYKILEAYSFSLPDDIYITFANTGKEREETLVFVNECAKQWKVNIIWLEWQKAIPYYKKVDFETANRQGKPFADLIDYKGSLPNLFVRFCTGDLKIKPIVNLLKREYNLNTWSMVLGIRYDEPKRVSNMRSKNLDWDVTFPLYDAKITKRQVMGFWSKQPFDLQLKPYQSNCELCFLKGEKQKLRIIEENPESANWWIEQENKFIYESKQSGKSLPVLFQKNGQTYEQLKRIALSQQSLFDLFNEDNLIDCFCTD